MSGPNVNLSYCRIYSPEKLVFSVSCSLSAGFVPVMNKLSSSSIKGSAPCISRYIYESSSGRLECRRSR
ncbi:BgTH12-01118 [Blumeria graminis f. sp. triticale]|uniref:BgTH12-01118 n=1 Tax=Blumeria graminis f. sp. triticale TaxID=1689686 RepID=A0A9W4GI66_BLUGR|nr:BgTH12-01118 [Blumeria graminis f. sp. triticale]